MSGTERYKILVVDDERMNIIALAQILKTQYEIVVAVNGRTAIETAEKHTPDIILLDVIMPDMSGYEVLAELKSSDATKNIPIIFITGLDGIEEEEKGLLLGAVDYITKPFHGSIVKARIRTHLKMVRYIRTIEHLCMLDTLTELPNRRGFDNRINAEWGRAVRNKTSIGLLMIDVDKFKNYNDTYGHPQGDVVLQTLGDILKKTLNRATDLASRWGGEEFAVLLADTDRIGILNIAEQIRVNVEQAVITCANGLQTSITVSIGAHGKIPEAEDTIAEFISAADQALYTAKHNGRNRVCSAF